MAKNLISSGYDNTIGALVRRYSDGTVEPWIRLSDAAQANVDETGTNVGEDVAALRNGTMTPDDLLASCLDGADDDRVQGWREYVYAVAAAARV